MGKKITIIIETQLDENKRPTGYSVEVKAGVFNKQKFLSDTPSGAFAKALHKIGKELKISMFTENLVDTLYSQGIRAKKRRE